LIYQSRSIFAGELDEKGINFPLTGKATKNYPAVPDHGSSPIQMSGDIVPQGFQNLTIKNYPLSPVSRHMSGESVRKFGRHILPGFSQSSF
jgi:hypothetical protein